MGQKVFVQLVQARVCGAHRRLKQRGMGERERERGPAAPKTHRKKQEKVCHCKPCHQFQLLFRVLSVAPGFACSVASLGPYPGYHLPGIAGLPPLCLAVH